jgi:dolichyl-phosphate-mannose--protein O-mannosyl transferase
MFESLCGRLMLLVLIEMARSVTNSFYPSLPAYAFQLSDTAYIVLTLSIIVVGTIVVFRFCRFFCFRRMAYQGVTTPVHEYAPERALLLPPEPHAP